MTGPGSSCGACKFLRRKCTSECVFAPYFCYDQAATHFAAVHKVFGASNVSKLLLHLPVQNRSDAAITISYEALARMRDPVYGCVAHILALQQQIASLQEEIDILGHQMTNLAVGIASCENPQATLNPRCEMQFSSLQDAMIPEYYQNPQDTQVNNSGYTTGNETLDSQMNVELPPLYEWEDQDPFCDFHPNCLDRLLEGVDQEIFPYWSWLDSANNAT
ncbi:LOB domain-containing protein 33 [Ricinus communis]|uniref:LOB domain-containing protein, putative n=1 Tax=Ricinus communis TaxID=3988 RepID=B9SDY8_RICCO|nr:LOB domain-containing protein 33 [Ricinus communis]EEF38131.1 LOB domain-containing protein, putative [Ricinus communis]|eukprot:XP_002524207.1 LOB domain-containing protein 33 [Ricinus communis]